MRITELNAEWVGAGGKGISDAEGNQVPERHGVGVLLDCPCGACGIHLFVPFSNPLDGGPQHGAQGWQRTGETFDTLTLTPSILRSKEKGGCGWHGYIRDGSVVNA